MSNEKSDKKVKTEKLITVKEDTDEQSLVDVQQMYEGVHTSVEKIKTAGKIGADTVHYTTKGFRHIQTGTARAVRGSRKLMTAVRSGNAGSYISGQLKTAAKTTAKGVAVGSVKTAVHIGKAGASNARDTLLQQKINKSTVTDTGIEAAKQGITYIREGDNVRKVAKNTYAVTKNTVNTVKKTPQYVVDAIKKAKKTAVKTAVILKSKIFWIVVLPAIGILLISNMINSMSGSMMTIISGTFGWLLGEDDVEDDSDEKKQIEKYIKIISKEVEDKQKEIDDVFYDFECDRFNYGDRREISEFRDEYFNYDTIYLNTEDRYIKAISIAAAKWYSRNVLNNDGAATEDVDIKLKKSELRDTVKYFYDFNYDYFYDYCPHWSCCIFSDYIMVSGDVHGTLQYNSGFYCDSYYHGCEMIREWVNYSYTDSDGSVHFDRDTVYTGERTFCTRKHRYLRGGVTNYSDSEILDRAGLTEEEKAMYDLYCEQIKEWLSE